jgi:hypothetical protein
VFDASAKTSLLQTDQYFQMHNAQYAAMSDPNNIMQLFMQQQQQDADAQAHIANLICSVRRDHLGKFTLVSKICIKYRKHGSSSFFTHIFNCVFTLDCYDPKVQFKAEIDLFLTFKCERYNLQKV